MIVSPIVQRVAQRRLKSLKQEWDSDKDSEASEWIEKHFYAPNVIHPETGEQLGEGPIVLGEYQGRVIREALSRLENGKFRYSTILWSEPKKSAKTTIAAAVVLWFASTQIKMGHLYCLANDGKGSMDREYMMICKAITLSRKHGGIFRDVRTGINKLTLPNGTIIEAIPCDPEGEAGAEPDMTVWGEVWGYRQQHKLRLWTELTIPPTKFGYALRWVESYAGYEGESELLEQLYQVGVKEAKPHPGITDVPLFVNEKAGMLSLWNEVPRLAWQTPEYYAEEALQLTESEFLRVHRNQWAAPVNEFIPIGMWDACQRDIPPLDKKTPIVLALDASISGDCCALGAAGRAEEGGENRPVLIHSVQIWTPPKGGKIDYSETIEPAIIWWVENYNVIEVAYDIYQTHKLVTDLAKFVPTKFEEFSQQKPRAVADKQLYDLIMAQEIWHDNDPEVRQHIQNSAAKSVDEKWLRIIKKVAGKPIDAAVVISMMAERIRYYNV